MIANRLRAVVPKRILGRDLEGEDVLCFARHGREVEAREDGFVACQRLARLVEGGLHDGVVLGEEVEFYEVADFGDDVFGLDCERELVAVLCVSGWRDGVAYSEGRR